MAKAKKKTTTRTTARKTTKKTTARKTVKRTTVTARKAAPARKKATIKVSTPLNKSQLFTHLSECTELTKKEISTLFGALSDVIQSHLKKSGPGEFTVPGLMKCKVVRKPATKARKGINPFTGEAAIFKAKPARNVIKVRPLKALKDMAN